MISVVICTYNGEKYVKECMENILSQTISKEKLEIIVVDDGSNDKTVEILEYYEKQYSGEFLLIKNEKNSHETLIGPGNTGINNAKGDYILFLDQDDKYREDAFEILHELMDKNPELDYIEYTFHYTDFEWNITHTTEKGKTGFYKYSIEGENKRIKLAEEKVLPGATFVWTKIYRRKFLMDNNIHFNEGKIFSGYGDNFFSGLVVNYAKNIGKFYDNLYFYRDYIGSYSHKKMINDQNQFERCKVGLIFLEECHRRGLYEKNCSFVEYIFLRTFLVKTFWKFIYNIEPTPYDKLYEIQIKIMELCPNYEKNNIILKRNEFKEFIELLKYEWDKGFLSGLKIGLKIEKNNFQK